MKNEKCINYHMLITYINGDKEEVNCSNIDKTDFTEMREYYNTIVKEKYKDNNLVYTIDFIGVTQQGKKKSLWKKEINVCNLKAKQEEYIEKNKDRDVREIVQEVIVRLNCLTEMKTYHNNKISECDVERSILLHEIELCKNKFFNSEKEKQDYINNIFEKQFKNETTRRFYKQTSADLKSMFRNLKIEDIIKNIEGWSKQRKAFNATPEEFKDKNKKEVYYKDDFERLSLISKYEKLKYDTVFWNKRRRKLIFIKHVGQGKMKFDKAPITIKQMK